MRDITSNNSSANWIKKPVTKEELEPLCNLYNISPLLASIFVRRGITEGKELLYYLQDDLRFQHNPFCFNGIDDAVERILQAKEDNQLYGFDEV